MQILSISTFSFILIIAIILLVGIVAILIRALNEVCIENEQYEKHLKSEPIRYFIEKSEYDTYAVYGKSDFGNTPVKKFTCTDNPEFARLLADELCDKLNEN